MATTTELTHNTSSYGTMGYRPDHDDPTKMVPNVRQNEFFPHATAPASGTLELPRPDHVLIVEGGQYFFHFNQGDLVNRVDFGYISGSTGAVPHAGAPTKLDIQPVDWHKAGNGTVGDVIFVYRGES